MLPGEMPWRPCFCNQHAVPLTPLLRKPHIFPSGVLVLFSDDKVSLLRSDCGYYLHTAVLVTAEIKIKNNGLKASLSRNPLITSHLWLRFLSYVVNLVFVLIKIWFDSEHSDETIIAVDWDVRCMVPLF